MDTGEKGGGKGKESFARQRQFEIAEIPLHVVVGRREEKEEEKEEEEEEGRHFCVALRTGREGKAVCPWLSLSLSFCVSVSVCVCVC